MVKNIFEKLNYNELIEVRDFIYNESGIYFFESRFDLLSLKIEERMNATKRSVFKEYFKLLKSSEVERRRFFDAITINETYFFREKAQFDVIFNYILPEVIDKERHIKIISAGCSTGAEPYTFAIMLLDKYSNFIDRFEIIGFDISYDVIDRAKEGLYSSYFLRNTEERIKNKYFIKEGKKYRIINEVKNYVSFRQGNIFSHDIFRFINDSFIIMCRNVLIYFDKASRFEAIKIFNRAIKDGGYLLLGHTEVVFGIRKYFKIEHYPGVIIYRKEVEYGDK